MTEIPDQWALYGALVIFILTIIGGATDRFLKIFGTWGQAAAERLDRQRSAAAAADDADIAERDRKIAYLEGVNAERLRELQARDQLIADHKNWDWERYDAAVRAGNRIDPPPPLLPILVAPAEGHDERETP